MTAADETETRAAVKGKGPRYGTDGTAPGVGEELVLEAGTWYRLHADQAVFRLEMDHNARRQITGDHGRQADAEVDQIVVLQFQGDTLGDDDLIVHWKVPFR